jgi:hypothetical protein
MYRCECKYSAGRAALTFGRLFEPHEAFCHLFGRSEKIANITAAAAEEKINIPS